MGPKVNYYSNPEVLLPATGTPTGVAGQADSADVLIRNRFKLAAVGDESITCKPTEFTPAPTPVSTTTLETTTPEEEPSTTTFEVTDFPTTVTTTEETTPVSTPTLETTTPETEPPTTIIDTSTPEEVPSTPTIETTTPKKEPSTTTFEVTDFPTTVTTT